jgi:hypothetical protein
MRTGAPRPDTDAMLAVDEDHPERRPELGRCCCALGTVRGRARRVLVSWRLDKWLLQWCVIRGAQRYLPVSEKSSKVLERSCRKLSLELGRPG